MEWTATATAAATGAATGAAPVTLADVAGLLRVNGRLPRRAVVLADGSLGDRTAHPHLAEVELLSRLCEVARQATNAPCYSRLTAPLLEQAVRTNAPAAWDAVRDDLVTGDLDLEAAAATVRQGQACMPLVACMVNARDDAHLAAVAMAVAALLPHMCDETRADLGRVLGWHLPALMDSFARHGATMRRDVRDALLSGFGRVLAGAGVPPPRVADMVLHAVHSRRDELLRLFVHTPAGYLRHKPQILPDLLDRARAAPAASRYPSLALLARVLDDNPEAAAACADDVRAIACVALDDADDLDDRVCLAVGALVSTCDGCGDRLAAKLAAALTACAATATGAAAAGAAASTSHGA